MQLQNIFAEKLDMGTIQKNAEERFYELSKKLYLAAENIKDEELKAIILTVLRESNRVKTTGDCCIYQINDSLESIMASLLTLEKLYRKVPDSDDLRQHQNNIDKIMSHSEQINGKSSFKTKSFGMGLMFLGFFFILLSVAPIAFGIVNLPGAGANVLLGLFGLSPALAGIALFKYGYQSFEIGRRHSLSKHLSMFANAVEAPKKDIVVANTVVIHKKAKLTALT